MDFSEALRLLKEGKKVRQHIWDEAIYLKLENRYLWMIDTDYPDEDPAYSDIFGNNMLVNEAILAEDWEEVNEPKTKK